MCGFVGMIGLDGAGTDPQLIDRMSAMLRHRGPDDVGAYISDSVGFGFRRLSILDLSATGHQPMVSEDGQVVLVFNGEIYNYLELRSELQTLGHEFRSRCDSEVLLQSYLQWGTACVEKFNGMWAFLIHDGRKRKIFGSRDRFGKKPLYYYRRDGYVFFASEIKAILSSGRYVGGPNWKTISQFLIQNELESTNETFYLGIEQLPAGTALELDLHGGYREWAYWSIADLPKATLINPEDLFYETFQDAMRLRLRSDVPVGVLLSGGMDSTSIACTLKAINGDAHRNPVYAFSFQAREFDESRYIDDTVKQTGVTLVHFSPDPNQLWEALQRVLWFQDEPVHSMSAVITFELCRLAAARGVKVLLNGGGPDEFLGYFSFFLNYWCTLVATGQFREAWQEICAYRNVHGGNPEIFFLQSVYSYLISLARPFSAYRKIAGWKSRLQTQHRSWFSSELFDHLPSERSEYDNPDIDVALRKAVERTPLPLYLRINDRSSMAHSIEQRMPFLDYRLVSLAFQLPANWKMRGPWNKYILRQAMRGRIPESVRGRLDKMGFPVPAKTWFGGPLHGRIHDVLNSQAVRERGIYNVDTIRRDLALQEQGKIDVSVGLFRLAQFELWSKICNSHAVCSE